MVFCTIEILAADGVQEFNTRDRAKFRQDRSSRYGDIAIYRFLEDGGLPHEQYSSVLTAIQSLVAIDAVVLVIMAILILHPFGLKTPIFTPPKRDFGYF